MLFNKNLLKRQKFLPITGEEIPDPSNLSSLIPKETNPNPNDKK